MKQMTLVANTPVGVEWNFGFAKNGSTDVGYDITSPHSELSYMYDVSMGLKGYFSAEGVLQPDFGIFGNGTVPAPSPGTPGNGETSAPP
jgi:hypothetical protein